jgi:hypothetical protein
MSKISRYLILVTVLILVGGVAYYAGSRNSVGINSNIDLQAKCATQAQEAFKTFETKYTDDGWDGHAGVPVSTHVDFDYTNHYNQQLNKCFVLITYDFNEIGSGQTKGESLLDAYENSELASCVFDSTNGQSKDVCIIGNSGNSGATYQEYSNFVNQRMELNQ